MINIGAQFNGLPSPVKKGGGKTSSLEPTKNFAAPSFSAADQTWLKQVRVSSLPNWTTAAAVSDCSSSITNTL